MRAIHVKQCYGLSMEDYENLFTSQKGACAICGTPLEKYSKDSLKTAHVDHCHTTGKVRGLLCSPCNRGIGYLRDDIEILKSAIKYLEK